MNETQYTAKQIRQFERTIHEFRTNYRTPEYYASVTIFKTTDKRLTLDLHHYILNHYQYDIDYRKGTLIIYWLLKK
jgi:hypothetical protein